MQQNASHVFIGLSLTLLYLIGSECLPLQRRFTDSSQQPARCRLTRPKSSHNSRCSEEEKPRRYFLHESNPRGCKKFGICPEDALTYDNQTQEAEDINYFLTFEDCQKECMQHVSCPQVTVGENLVLVSDNNLEGWGKKVTYQCSTGYSLADNTEKNTRTCQKNGTWSGDEPVCIEQCQTPPPVHRAHIAPAKEHYRQGSAVHYTCQVGYMLRGSAQRTCGSNGTWINPEPSCVCQVASETDECPSCPEPARIEHGHASAPSRSLNAIVEYHCDPGYILIGNQTRECREDGGWSGEDPPICWNLTIVKKQNEGVVDVTNTSITVIFDSRNIKFKAVSSTPNPFPDSVPEWHFEGKKELPHGLEQKGLELSFMTIFRSNEQIGVYSIIFGNFSAFFQLGARDEPQEQVAPSVIHLQPGADYTTSPGSTEDFACVLAGCPIPAITWYHDDVALEDGDPRIVIDTVSSYSLVVESLKIVGVNKNDTGSYRCEGVNAAGSASTDSVQLTVANSAKKRSVEDVPEPTLCSSSPDTVTLVGKVKRELKQTRSSSLSTYRVQVKRFLQGSDRSLKKIRTVLVDSKPLASEERLNTNLEYIFQGRLIDSTMFLSRQNVYRHTRELENLIKSC